MNGTLFYKRLAPYYDRIYHYVDYTEQTQWLCEIIRHYKRSRGKAVLDVCCGTGKHAGLLSAAGFEVTGVDISPEMLVEARRKNPHLTFVEGDMRRLSLNQRYDVVLCLFNSILYNTSVKDMRRTMAGFCRLLKPGGLGIFDVVDKNIGIHSRCSRFEYGDDEVKIRFSPQWKYSPGMKTLRLDISFALSEGGKTTHLRDRHTMGAFSMARVVELALEQFSSVWLLERSFDGIEPHDAGKLTAVVVARKT